ncbi:MAG: hypothetical protein MUP67_13770, partial [Acidimicrobiia bacterium]|nr:hypothetical protein [Acidimicrobiia bacterium]
MSTEPAFARSDVEFEGAGDVALRGWYYVPVAASDRTRIMSVMLSLVCMTRPVFVAMEDGWISAESHVGI